MLETGDWWTPRSIPDETAPFFEKPPLKFWIVAAGIRSGLLPHDEFGQRFWDALFGALAVLYVYAIGVRLGGPVSGVVAAFTLFVHRPLLLQHGLRTQNMEAALLLCYCGGVYHALAWSAASNRIARTLHPFAVVLFFVLGFMTKFVAALFLPALLVLMVVAFPAWRARLRADWRPWLAAVVLGGAIVAPWFIYQHAAHGERFWQVLLSEHVYKRMTAFLESAHVQPWLTIQLGEMTLLRNSSVVRR
jgi:4-amino-4-deoxy-L-arabinose transferase-like glycosyltransferase